MPSVRRSESGRSSSHAIDPRSRGRNLAAALIAAGVVSVAGSEAASRPEAPEQTNAAVSALAGRWRLNAEQSEDARAKMREAMAGRTDRRGGGRGGFGRGRGPVGGGPSGPRPGGGRPADGPTRSIFEPAQLLTIAEDGAELTLDRGDGRVVRLRPGGPATRADGGKTEIKARWNGAELVTEAKTENGARLTTAYLAVPEKNQLHVTSRMEGGRLGRAVTVRHVYDPEEPDQVPVRPPAQSRQ